ncbi:MAG: hypothetical protein JJW01_03585 [Alphaproteobacteria bacterium]|nr:hypothetical protein [Rickettsiales bacterium]
MALVTRSVLIFLVLFSVNIYLKNGIFLLTNSLKEDDIKDCTNIANEGDNIVV